LVVLDRSERETALRTARRAIEQAILPPSLAEPEGAPAAAPAGSFAERRGVFVTIRHYPDDDLRGCIGYPLPVLPLAVAIERAAVAAATEDPRFHPVRPTELPHLTLEVSVLTAPERIPSGTPEAILEAVRVGRDGLIIDGFGAGGLLLPQVAPEQGWNAEEFLAGVCEKAGLPSTAWRRPGVKIQRFEAEVFREASPGGALVDVPPVSAPGERPAR
jgi:uncharacterized protein